MNKVILIGNVVSAPDIKQYNFGKVAKFRLAVDRGYTDETDFPDIVAFHKQAELIEKYVDQGKKIAIDGELHTGSYEKDGVTHRSVEVVANRIEFL